MSTTPAALSEQRLKELRARVVGGDMRIDKMYDAGTIVGAIDQLLALRSRPNEGMAEALNAIARMDNGGNTRDVADLFHEAREIARASLALPAAVAPESE